MIFPKVMQKQYLLSVGVMLPLRAVLSAAWMDVEPVSWKNKQKQKKPVTLIEQVIQLINLIHSGIFSRELKERKESLTSSIIFNRLLIGAIEEAGCEINIPVTYRLKRYHNVTNHMIYSSLLRVRRTNTTSCSSHLTLVLFITVHN